MTEKINFTKESIASLLPRDDGKRREVWDTKVNGLVVFVTVNGVKTFYFRKRARGSSTETIRIGRFPDLTPEQARKEASKLFGEFARGENPAQTMRNFEAELSIGDLFKKYMKTHGDNKARPDKMYDLYRLYLLPWDKRKISSLKFIEVDEWHKTLPSIIKKRSNKAVSGYRSANMALSLLHAMYQRAISKRWYVGENPATGVEKFPEESRKRFLQSDETSSFFQSLADEPNRTIRDWVLISLFCGGRRAKTLSMRWDEINFELAEWTPSRKINEKNVAVVPLVPEVIEILNSRRNNGSDFVFESHTSKTGHIVNPSKGWARINKRAGIKNFKPHDLRRSLGSWQAKTGASLVIIGKSLGHESLQATQIYSHLDLDPVRQSVERATSAILNSAGLKGGEVIPLKKKA